MSDAAFSEDEIVVLCVWASVLAHLAVLVWYWLRRNVTAVLAVNLMVSGSIAAYWALHLGELLDNNDVVTAFVAFEAVVLATSIAAFTTNRVPRLLILAECAGNALLSAYALYFLLTFKITRLF